MAFQLGPPSDFPSMLAALRAGNWERAADEMLWVNGATKVTRSRWHATTPKRCETLAAVVRGEASS